jgi:hypothetical protein
MPSGRPLKSELLPNHIVEEIVKQAKIKRRNGGKKEVCQSSCPSLEVSFD